MWKRILAFLTLAAVAVFLYRLYLAWRVQQLKEQLEQETKEGPDYASKSKKISRIRDPLEDDDWPEYDIQLREAVRIAGDWVKALPATAVATKPAESETKSR